MSSNLPVVLNSGKFTTLFVHIALFCSRAKD